MTWRLSKTLKRRIDVRPIENEDVKYAWAAYKQDKLGQIKFSDGLNALDFKTAFEGFVLTRAQAAWTVLGETNRGLIPIGIVLGQWGPGAAFMLVSAIAWYPWASRRNIVEGTVKLFNNLRKQFPVMGFANDEHRPLYEACAMHGIMRRIGTSHSLGSKMTIFEVRNEQSV
jgi:hypothetical protein